MEYSGTSWFMVYSLLFMEDWGEISAEWRVQSGEYRGEREEFLLAVARSAIGTGGYT